MRNAVALSVAFLLLAACVGGGGPSGSSDASGPSSRSDSASRPPVDLRVPSTPTIEKLTLRTFSDTYLKTSEYWQRDLSFAGGNVKDNGSRHFGCDGRSCTVESECVGTTCESKDANNPGTVSTNRLGRSQFRVLTYEWKEKTEPGGLTTDQWSYVRKTPYDTDDSTITVAPTSYNYGIWGDDAYANVRVQKGRYAGVRKSDGVSFSGTIAAVGPYIAGRRAGVAPGGIGSARWEGPAEAVAIATYTRRRGAATLTIPDLSDPKLSVSVVVQNKEIGSSDWNSIRLTGSGFDVGADGRNRLVGFFGPGHRESYGIFDTDAYIGVFGAKRK